MREDFHGFVRRYQATRAIWEAYVNDSNELPVLFAAHELIRAMAGKFEGHDYSGKDAELVIDLKVEMPPKVRRDIAREWDRRNGRPMRVGDLRALTDKEIRGFRGIGRKTAEDVRRIIEEIR